MQRAIAGVDAEEFRAIHVEGRLNAVSYAVSLLVSGADGNYTSTYRSAAGRDESRSYRQEREIIGAPLKSSQTRIWQ